MTNDGRLLGAPPQHGVREAREVREDSRERTDEVPRHVRRRRFGAAVPTTSRGLCRRVVASIGPRGRHGGGAGAGHGLHEARRNPGARKPLRRAAGGPAAQLLGGHRGHELGAHRAKKLVHLEEEKPLQLALRNLQNSLELRLGFGRDHPSQHLEARVGAALSASPNGAVALGVRPRRMRTRVASRRLHRRDCDDATATIRP
mmetsp:Transcript_25436/g.70889  ORF Transcript_25436/g.70889 Transcript_25436/m.70889 type:complete len:202 (+) Transcript_25436:2164-2769(+)